MLNYQRVDDFPMVFSIEMIFKARFDGSSDVPHVLMTCRTSGGEAVADVQGGPCLGSNAKSLR